MSRGTTVESQELCIDRIGIFASGPFSNAVFYL